MAKVRELDEANWNEWVASRPESMREICREFPPDRLYRMGSTGHRCTIYSYAEDGTLTVTVSGEHNAVLFARNVFGIEPEELEECDLPPEDETIGEVLTEAGDIQVFAEERRAALHTEGGDDG